MSLGDRTPIAALVSVIVGEVLWPQPIRSNMLYQKSKTLHEPFTFVLEQGRICTTKKEIWTKSGLYIDRGYTVLRCGILPPAGSDKCGMTDRVFILRALQRAHSLTLRA